MGKWDIKTFHPRNRGTEKWSTLGSTYLPITFKLFMRAGFILTEIKSNLRQIPHDISLCTNYHHGSAQHYPSSTLMTVDGLLPLNSNHLCWLLWKFCFGNSPCQAVTDKASPSWWSQIRLPQREFHNHTRFQFFLLLILDKNSIFFYMKKYCQHIISHLSWR